MNTSSRSLLCILLPLCFLNGCVNIARYPAAWEKPATSISNIEKRIVGDYSCNGKTLHPSSHEVGDGGFLPHSLNVDVKGGCDTVRFRQVKEGELEVTILNDGIVSETKKFLAGVDYSTANGWLVIRKSESGLEREGFAIVAGHMTGSDSITLDISGDLIVKTSFVAAGFVVIIPIVGIGTTWSMYERQSN